MKGFVVAAFVSSKPAFPSITSRSSFVRTSASLAVRAFPSRRPDSGALSMRLAPVADYTGAASSFFTSVRIPAALIAGSSLAAVFTLVNETRDSEAGNRRVIESMFLLIYHVLALISLLLSLNVIFTATATSNALLLGANNPMATSAYALLHREYAYEFLLTRWSFYTALLAFLGCIASRLLLEFELLSRKRIRSAMLVVSSVSALGFQLLSIVNSRPPDFLSMTGSLIQMYLLRSLTGKVTFCEIASVFSLLGAVVSGISVFRLGRLQLFSRAKPGQNEEADPPTVEESDDDELLEDELEDFYATSLDGSTPTS